MTVYKRGEETKLKKFSRLAFLPFAIIYIAVLLRATVIKDGVRIATNELRLVPFNTVFGYLRGEKSLNFLAVNYLGNIFLFLPFGLILPVIFNKLNIQKAIVLGLLTSVIIELIQHFTGCGYADIDDVLMNVLGVILGAFSYYNILGGKKRTFISYILTFVVILIIAVSGFFFISKTNPQMLPDKLVFYGGKVAGKPIDSYDLYVKCYKMSHGEVFAKKENSYDESSYFIADTAIFVIHKYSYSVVGIDEIIDEISKRGGCYLKLWLDENGNCSIILLEE